MGTPPTDVAKALMDALPSLDYKRLLEDARRSFGIVLVGDTEAAQRLLALLRGSAATPADVAAAIWVHQDGVPVPVPLGKTELALVIPATDETIRRTRDLFAGVALLPIVLGDARAPDGVSQVVRLPALESDAVRRTLVPALVDRLWERRLAVGRALPSTRDRISHLLVVQAVKDIKVLLGSVAGAGAGRSGAPTPATAQLLVHQARLIVALGAVYGAELQDKRALVRRVTPHLTPTLLLDLAESQVSRLAHDRGRDDRLKQFYATAAAVVTRPALTATSTYLTGMAARRVFRGGPAPTSMAARLRGTLQASAQQLSAHAGQGTRALGQLFEQRLHRHEVQHAEGVPMDQDTVRGTADPADAP